MSKRKRQEAEELVRTQVLNIDEVRKVVKYEKKISKKPAAVFAILGTLMLALGTTFQGVIVYKDKNVSTINHTKQDNISARQIIPEESTTTPVKEVETSLVCYFSSQGNENGTNYESHFTYNFVNNQLKSAIKVFMLDKIEGNPIGESSMKNLYTAYQTFERSNEVIDGYSIKTAPRGEWGFQVTTQIDLTKLNISLIPANYQNNLQIKVDFVLDTTAEVIKPALEELGYSCTLEQEQSIEQ